MSGARSEHDAPSEKRGAQEPVPRQIRQEGPRLLGITWSDGLVSRYPVRALRLACPCAHCVDELSGQRILNPAAVAEDVHPEHLEAVGLYAIRIRWSDGHSSGIYSFRTLRQLHPQPYRPPEHAERSEADDRAGADERADAGNRAEAGEGDR